MVLRGVLNYTHIKHRCIVVVGWSLARCYGSFSDRCLTTANIDTSHCPLLGVASIEVIRAGRIKFLPLEYTLSSIVLHIPCPVFIPGIFFREEGEADPQKTLQSPQSSCHIVCNDGRGNEL